MQDFTTTFAANGGSIIQAGNITGSGGIITTGATSGNTTFTGNNNSYAGATNVNSGTLTILSVSGLGDGTTNTSSVTVANAPP